MTKPKFDLSNPGGQPKGWLDEPKDDSEWFEDIKMLSGLALIGLLLLVCVGSLIYGFFKLVGKI